MISNYKYLCRLQPIGRAEVPRSSGDYEAGQCFVHRVFAYRGVILFSYVTEINDSSKLKRSVEQQN